MKQVQLFCLTYAGGSANFFDELRERLDGKMLTYSFEYAGHGTRLKDGFYRDFRDLSEDAASFINERLMPDTRLMIFGYSMGTISAYEIMANGLLNRKPEHIFLASHESPSVRWESKTYMNMTDEDFIRSMRKYGGFDDVTPQRLKNRFFRKMYFDPIREDYRLLGNYPEDDRYSFDMPATMMYSPQDISEQEIHSWDKFFAGEHEYIAIGDGHFFLNECAAQTAEIILDRAGIE